MAVYSRGAWLINMNSIAPDTLHDLLGETDLYIINSMYRSVNACFENCINYTIAKPFIKKIRQAIKLPVEKMLNKDDYVCNTEKCASAFRLSRYCGDLTNKCCIHVIKVLRDSGVSFDRPALYTCAIRRMYKHLYKTLRFIETRYLLNVRALLQKSELPVDIVKQIMGHLPDERIGYGPPKIKYRDVPRAYHKDLYS